MKDKVLLIIPAFNEEKNIEHVVDNLIMNHPEMCIRDRIYREKPSGGAEHHFLQLLSEADGRYVMLSDQDDVWLPEKMRLLYNEIQKMEEKWGDHMPILLHSDMEVVDEDKNRIADSYFTYQKISPERTKLCQELVQNNVTGGAVIMNQAMLSYFKQIPSVCPVSYTHLDVYKRQDYG